MYATKLYLFFVQFAPFSGDRVILSGAEDREVRLHDLSSFETVKVLSSFDVVKLNPIRVCS